MLVMEAAGLLVLLGNCLVGGNYGGITVTFTVTLLTMKSPRAFEGNIYLVISSAMTLTKTTCCVLVSVVTRNDSYLVGAY